MPFRQPLIEEQLHDIKERRKGDADAEALLWEIARLYALLYKMDWIRRTGPNPNGFSRYLTDEAWKMLENEPCIIDRKAWRKELLDGWRSLHDPPITLD